MGDSMCIKVHSVMLVPALRRAGLASSVNIALGKVGEVFRLANTYQLHAGYM